MFIDFRVGGVPQGGSRHAMVTLSFYRVKGPIPCATSISNQLKLPAVTI